MINTIKEKIITKLEAITSIAEVNNYERVGFEGNPAVNVTVAGNSNQFWSVASNQRGYNFTIRVFIPLKGNPAQAIYDNSKEQAEVVLADVVDAIIEAFDEDITLTDTVEFLKAAPSDWGYVEAEDGWQRTADVNLQAIKITNVR